MSKASEPVLLPLVADGAAILEKINAVNERREKQVEKLKAIDEEIKTLDTKLQAVNARLLEQGGGRFTAESTPYVATVVAAVPAVKQPDSFVLPTAHLETARELAGEHFKKLFTSTVIYAPRNGFDAVAEILLPARKARELVALCLVEGKLIGGRAAHVRWKN